MIKQLGLIFIVVLFSVSIVSALDEHLRCDGANICDFNWDVVNKSTDYNIKISTPCNVTIYNSTKDEVWSVMSVVKNTWHNVTMPVSHLTTNFGGGWYKAERNCSGAISSFNFMPNISLESYLQGNITINTNVSVDTIGIADAVWNHTGSYTSNSTGSMLDSMNESGDYLAIIIGTLIISMSFFYMATQLKERHPMLQIGLIIFGLFMIVANINLMLIISEAESEIITVLTGLYQSMLWISIFIVAYIFLWFLASLLKNFSKLKGDKFVDDF